MWGIAQHATSDPEAETVCFSDHSGEVGQTKEACKGWRIRQMRVEALEFCAKPRHYVRVL